MAIENISAILDPKVRSQALVRIGYFDDTKKQGRQVDHRRLLDWFVKLSQANLMTMRPTELRELREEVRAIQEEGYGDVIQYQIDADTAAQLPEIQNKVAEYLGRLTTTGRIEFEAFELYTSIELPRFRPGPKLLYGSLIGEHVDPLHGKGLLYSFFLGLKGAGDRLRQCQHCPTLFVQARRKQQFCTRACQRVASMRALRNKRRKEQEARNTRRHLRQRKGAKHSRERR